MSRVQVGTERPRTTTSKEGKGERKESLACETATYQYWFAELKNRKDTEYSKSYQSHIEKGKE